MMRGKEYFAVACRRANGEITATAEPIEQSILGKLKWLNRPFLRGTLALADSLILGMKALMWSGNLAMEDEKNAQVVAAGTGTPAPVDGVVVVEKSSRVGDIALTIVPFLSIAIAVVIFFYVPTLLARLTTGHFTNSRVYLGLTEGGIKLAFFFLYVWGISRWDEIHKVFQYHGAEHKVINAYEAGEDLTVENVQKYSTVHVRCGTSFLLIVILVSIIIFLALTWNSVVERFIYKLLLLPVVAGIAYEIIKVAGNKKSSKLMRLVLAPGLLMQRITTQEPDDNQVEVAIRSLEGVLEAETGTDRGGHGT